MQNRTPEITIAPPTLDEIKRAKKSLKPRTSSLDIEAEILQVAFENDKRFQILFTQFIQETWRVSSVPEQWGISKIRAIWKRKGSPTDAEKYEVFQ